MHVLSFTVPRMPPVPPLAQVEQPIEEKRWRFDYDGEYREQVRKLTHVRDSVRQGFSWVASLRTVNRAFRKVIDRPRNVTPYSNLWFLSAVALELDPPIQLYAEGTYQQVCQVLLADKVMRARQGPRGRTIRTICIAPHLPPAQSSPTTPQPGLPLHSISRRNCIQDSQDSNGTGNVPAVHQLHDSIPFVPPQRSPAIQKVSAPKADQPGYVARSNRYVAGAHIHCFQIALS